ncbi:MAG: crossover junction endodeoxyribonuclease RuvC [Myxococcaceae bacterium]
MRVLGIDPGTRFTGFGVVEEIRGQLFHVGHGVVKADPDAPLETRLKQIFAALSQAFASFRPDAVAVEGVFSHRNARSALILGHARGVALLVAAQNGISVCEYAPAKVKKSVGAGGADGKDAVARMVQTLLRVSDFGRADASDALAVAICHLNQSRFRPVGAGPSLKLPKPKSRKGALAALADRISPSYVRAVGTR